LISSAKAVRRETAEVGEEVVILISALFSQLFQPSMKIEYVSPAIV